MKIIRAKSAGFCFGVERAIGIARKCTDCGKNKVYTDGPLIHNRQMMERLKEEGILEIGDYQSSNELKNELSSKKADDVLVVRAHGVSPERREYLKNLGLIFKDATCPDVGRIAGAIKIHAKKRIYNNHNGRPETSGSYRAFGVRRRQGICRKKQ